MLWLGLLFLIAAHLPWPRNSLWQLWSELAEVIRRAGWRGGSVYLIWAILFSRFFFIMIPPWPWCVRMLAANAPLRWLCRVIAVTSLFWFSFEMASNDRISRIGRGLSGPSWCIILSAYTSAIGLWLLPGRKNTAPLIPPGHDPETPAATYDESSRR